MGGGGGDTYNSKKKKEILPAKKKKNSEIMKFLVRGEGGGASIPITPIFNIIMSAARRKIGGLVPPWCYFFF